MMVYCRVLGGSFQYREERLITTSDAKTPTPDDPKNRQNGLSLSKRHASDQVLKNLVNPNLESADGMPSD
jgi:hypothetical protein